MAFATLIFNGISTGRVRAEKQAEGASSTGGAGGGTGGLVYPLRIDVHKDKTQRKYPNRFPRAHLTRFKFAAERVKAQHSTGAPSRFYTPKA